MAKETLGDTLEIVYYDNKVTDTETLIKRGQGC